MKPRLLNNSSLVVWIAAAMAIVLASIAISTVPSAAALAADAAPSTNLRVANTQLTAQGDTVYIAKSSTNKIYHLSATCSGMKNPISMSLSDAVAGGYRPCEKCAHSEHATGWSKVDGKWYYYDDSGTMVTSKWQCGSDS